MMLRTRLLLLHSAIPLLLVALLPGPADAQRSRRGHQPPDPAQAARDLAAAGDFAGALVELERVLGETGDENLRVDVARTLAQLDRPMDALAAYDEYLVFKGDTLAEAERAVLDAEMAAVLARIGRIRISVDQENVEIRLDGRSIGFSPLVVPVRVEAGPHVVELFHPRYEDERIEIDAPAGEVTPVEFAMREPPPPPPPPPPPLPGQSPAEIRAREEARQAKEIWDGGGWNPMPFAMPWTWATSVPAGGVLSLGVGVGDLTQTDAFDQVGPATGGVGYRTTTEVNHGLSLPMPTFLGYRLHAAPMFAVGGFFQYQLHDVYVRPDAGLSNGEATSLFAGLKVRFYFPLGLLEPWIGVGGGFAHARLDYDNDWGNQHWTMSLDGATVPIEVGLDVVPWDYITAGFSFLYGFALWQKYCWDWSGDAVEEQCPAAGDVNYKGEGGDIWSFDFHVNFYLR
jgi:hypothetical protein